jgi:hypothetical protein
MTLTPGRCVNRFRNGSTLVVDTLVLLWVGAALEIGRGPETVPHVSTDQQVRFLRF